MELQLPLLPEDTWHRESVIDFCYDEDLGWLQCCLLCEEFPLVDGVDSSSAFSVVDRLGPELKAVSRALLFNGEPPRCKGTEAPSHPNQVVADRPALGLINQETLSWSRR